MLTGGVEEQSLLFDRRNYMRVLGGAAAAAAGLSAASSASAAEYETITVGEGEAFTASLGSGDTLENVLIDVTADNADVHIGADGDGWVVRNVGIHGTIDIGDDSPGGDDASYEGGYNSVFTVDASSGGNGVIENVYLGDGIEPGTDKSALITATQHEGHIDVRNVTVGGFSTTCFYVSGFGREGTGGTMTIEDSYFANSAGTAHIRPAGNVTIRNCTITNTNEAVYIPRTFGGLTQAMTSRGIWTSYSGSTTLVENCDIDVREENTCEAPWNYSGPCQANAVWAGEAPIDLVDSEVRGTVGGNVSQTGTGSSPDLSLPSGAPSSAEAAASGDAGSGGSGNDDGGNDLKSISVSGGTPSEPVEYAFAVDESVELGYDANSEDSVDDNAATGLVAGGTDSYRFESEVTDFTANGEVSVSIDGVAVDPNSLASDGSYREDTGGEDTSDGSDEESSDDSPSLDRSITISGGSPSDRIQYSFAVSEAVEVGPNANSEDYTSDTSATGIVAGGADDFHFAGEITSFDADGDVSVAVDGESVDPAQLGDDGGSDDTTDEEDSSEDDSDDENSSGDEQPELTETITISGGSPSNLLQYSFLVSEAVAEGPDTNSEDSASGTSASGAVAGGSDDYAFAGEITAFDAEGDVSVTVNGESVDPEQFGNDGSDEDDSDDAEDSPELSRSITVSGGSPSDKIRYALHVSEAVAEGPNANSEDSASGTSASGVVAGGSDDYAFAGEVTAFDADADVDLRIDGESVDPASFGGSSGDDSGSDDSTDEAEEPPELTETIAISGGSPSNLIEYTFSVSEAVDHRASPNAEDSVSGDTATGGVAGGTDEYVFAGEVTSFDAAGDVSVTVNGSDVDPATLG